MYDKNKKIVLFDGTNTDSWKMRDGSDCNWTIENGELVVGHGDIISTVEYRDALIHVEFKCPDMPECHGQDKGNSGVYVHGCYEVQVLDSYGIEKPICNDCSAIYCIYTPLTNACLPPEQWQTYDIILRAPRYNENNAVIEDARMTILQNGLPVHNNIILHSNTPGGVTDHVVPKGPLMLQDHGNRVCFRNVWILPLDE